MQRGLSVEQDHIPVLQVALDGVADLEVCCNLPPVTELEVDLLVLAALVAAWDNHKVCPRPRSDA